MAELKINTEIDLENALDSRRAILMYFSTLSCSVGEALEPKVRALIQEKYPLIDFAWIDMNAMPEVSAQNQVFVEPTLLLFIDGREHMRKSRNVHLSDLDRSIQRIYELAFD